MITVKFTKVFTSGILNMIEINESMKFCNKEHAEEWINVAKQGIKNPLFNGSPYYIKNIII